MGGITTGRDALEFVACGARDVALGTVLFADPGAPARVRAELVAACADAGVATPDDARSLAKSPETERKSPRLMLAGSIGKIGPAVSPTKTQAHAPLRSLDQRMDALKRANDVRVKRAKLKKDLKEGKVRIETILGNPPEYVSTAKVIDILMAVPKFGRVKAGALPQHVPDQPVEDGRRAVRPAAHGADRPLQQR